MTDDEIGARFREVEFRYVAARLEALYNAVYRGDDTVYTRQRVERLETLQQRLMGMGMG